MHSKLTSVRMKRLSVSNMAHDSIRNSHAEYRPDSGFFLCVHSQVVHAQLD